MSVLITSLDRTFTTAHILTTTPTVVYTVPDGIAMAKGVAMKLAGVGTATIEWNDVSAEQVYLLASGLPIDTPTFYHDFDLLGMTLEPGDQLQVTADAADTIHVTTVILESFGR